MKNKLQNFNTLINGLKSELQDSNALVAKLTNEVGLLKNITCMSYNVQSNKEGCKVYSLWGRNNDIIRTFINNLIITIGGTNRWELAPNTTCGNNIGYYDGKDIDGCNELCISEVNCNTIMISKSDGRCYKSDMAARCSRDE